MDGDGGLNMRDWGYYDSPAFKNHVGLQLMSGFNERKPNLLGGRDPHSMAMTNANGAFHQRDCGIPPPPYPMEFMRDAWIHRENNKFLNMLPTSPNYAVLPDAAPTHHPMQMLRQQPETSSTEERLMVQAEGTASETINGPNKKRSAGAKAEKVPKTKKPKKAPNVSKDGGSASVQRGARATKKITEVVINGIDMDISSIPIPVCSCTGTPQQCYRWGSGGWQSACCTTAFSQYPLPMSTKRRGARIAGRKMSLGAFKKVLEKLASEGYNFSNPIDLRAHWAKHGTNKFVTIR